MAAERDSEPSWPDQEQARSLALALLAHDLTPEVLVRAREHVDRQPPTGDVELYVLCVARHLHPLPANREWRTRHGRIRRRLARDAQHDLPERAVDPVVIATDKRIEAARAAWAYLHSIGLAGSAPDDLVTATLKRDLAADVRGQVA